MRRARNSSLSPGRETRRRFRRGDLADDLRLRPSRRRSRRRQGGPLASTESKRLGGEELKSVGDDGDVDDGVPGRALLTGGTRATEFLTVQSANDV